jgi:hypothetical protein
LEIDTGQAGAYHQLGRVAEEQERWSEAVDFYCKAAEIYAAYPGDYNQTIVMDSLKRVWQAAPDFVGKTAVPGKLAAILAISPAAALARLQPTP